jgi:hypothetical protein
LIDHDSLFIYDLKNSFWKKYNFSINRGVSLHSCIFYKDEFEDQLIIYGGIVGDFPNCTIYNDVFKIGLNQSSFFLNLNHQKKFFDIFFD